MDNQTLQRIKDILSRSQRVAVAVGKNPTIDDMGAGLALYLSLQSMGKTAAIVAGTEPVVEISNLVGIDKVKTRYEADGADLVVSFPYKEGEIEKVSYTIDNGYLNIVVKAGEQGLTFQERDVKYTRGGGGGKIDALFAVGVVRLSDLQGMFDMDTLKDVTIVNIDNKPDNQGYGDVVLVSPRFSSVSEQMAQFLADMNTEPDVDVAQNLLDGISYATENFQSPQTSFLAFEMAGILMRQGALRARLQPAPRHDFTQNRAPQVPDRPQQSPVVQQPRVTQPAQQPAPMQNSGSQGQQRRPQPQQNTQDRRQQFEERRQQFQDRRPQQNPSVNSQPRQNPVAPVVQSVPTQTQQPVSGTMQNQATQQPRYSQPVSGTMQNPTSQQPVMTNPISQAPAPQAQPVQQPMQSQTSQQPQGSEDLNPPSDWLTPKVYKGSTNI